MPEVHVQRKSMQELSSEIAVFELRQQLATLQSTMQEFGEQKREMEEELKSVKDELKKASEENAEMKDALKVKEKLEKAVEENPDLKNAQIIIFTHGKDDALVLDKDNKEHAWCIVPLASLGAALGGAAKTASVVEAAKAAAAAKKAVALIHYDVIRVGSIKTPSIFCTPVGQVACGAAVGALIGGAIGAAVCEDRGKGAVTGAVVGGGAGAGVTAAFTLKAAACATVGSVAVVAAGGALVGGGFAYGLLKLFEK